MPPSTAAPRTGRGPRFGPQAIRTADYLPQDGSRPSLAPRTDGLVDLRVYNAWDVEMFAGDIERSLPALELCVEQVARSGAIPVSLGGDHSIAFPDAKGCANVVGADRSRCCTSTPTPTPATSASARCGDAVRRICLELPVVGMDAVEVSPPYDHADITAALANGWFSRPCRPSPGDAGTPPTAAPGTRPGRCSTADSLPARLVSGVVTMATTHADRPGDQAATK